ncbi:sensor histidine kinase [Pseudonocardia abyssalis]|uniref:histidine kinase n=1 Tax=Pseudonocardia abyssalis TaxID=2792008 RepID=A0ABS6UNA0_9PSEU|nr:histidine kinase [Pseudonocardia abyssalis]MBW0115025.1 sensor histidine kinase [Pseudonocardia abyssalis]MBW0133731.1 sensor histidine kinase [Pseudonocardia abyssalis]
MRWARFVGTELLAVALTAVVAVLGEPAFAWSVPAALVGCALLPLRHVWPPLALLGVLAGLAGGLGWPPALVALYRLGRHGRSVPRVLLWLVLPVVAAVAPVFATQDLRWNQGVLVVGYVVVNAAAATVVGMLVGTRARLVESATELARVRDSALAARADAARAEERARIGREIHDAVGHHITLIAVGAAALAASTREEGTRRAADELRALAKRSLGEVRTALGLVSSTAGAGTAGAVVSDVDALVAQWREAGLAVELVDARRTTDLPPALGRAAYRVVQESLTNAARHAPGSEVRVEIGSVAGSLSVRVDNTASAEARDVVGRGGAGLTGLTERVGAVGGRITAGPRPDGGFTVEAWFPPQPAPVA